MENRPAQMISWILITLKLTHCVANCDIAVQISLATIYTVRPKLFVHELLHVADQASVSTRSQLKGQKANRHI
ncbi:hypothetical protein K449DRAFT_380845 [Hypoxylon sp. EC38]|nr:hypothetical protein K449DRAFT_380845 [Hypoxylon sp. EC38]